MEAFEREQKIGKLMHRVFKQSEDGRELLKELTDSAFMLDISMHGTDPFLLGREEGKRLFIRNIHLTIEQQERGNTNE